MLRPVSRAPKSNLGLRQIFQSTSDLQILKQKTSSGNTPFARTTPIPRNEANTDLTASDNEAFTRRHGEEYLGITYSNSVTCLS